MQHKGPVHYYVGDKSVTGVFGDSDPHTSIIPTDGVRSRRAAPHGEHTVPPCIERVFAQETLAGPSR
jgi:hypothetical protein